MWSLSRNTRRAHYARRTRTLGVGLALTLMGAAALADGAHRFVFTAYADAAGGHDVVAGRYGAALEELKSQDIMSMDPPATNTNRCVAYSMTLQWRQARAACDAAVRAAREQENAVPAWWSWSAASDEDSVALAYANRAVMRWLVHDDAGAREDLAKARALAPHAGFVAQNFAALRVHGALAQAGTPVPKS